MSSFIMGVEFVPYFSAVFQILRINEGETIKTRYTVNNNTPRPWIPAIQRSLQQDRVRRLPIVTRAGPDRPVRLV